LIYKVAIIGVGLIGEKRLDSVISDNKEAEIVALCDIDRGKIDSLAHKFGIKAYSDWRDIIKRNDINVIVIATPNKFLKDISLAALDAGKHVLCEKPLGRNAAEAEEIFNKAKDKKKVLMTGFNHRYHPAIYKAKTLVENNKIGELYYLKCTYGHGGRPGYEKEWRANKDLCGGGELLDQGVHVVDLFRWFLGEFDEVFGHIDTFCWDMEVEDNAFAMFETRKGQLAVMHSSWTQWKNKFAFEIFGEKGYLVIKGLGGSYGTETLMIGKRRLLKTGQQIASANQLIYAGGVPEEEVIEFPGPDISWKEDWKEFISAINENREPLGSGYDGLMANRMIEAVYKSAEINSPVKISHIGSGR